MLKTIEISTCDWPYLSSKNIILQVSPIMPIECRVVSKYLKVSWTFCNSSNLSDLSSHWFAVFPMRIQNEYLTSFRKDRRREASGSNELGSAVALGVPGVPMLFAHPRCYRPGVSAWVLASCGNPSPRWDKWWRKSYKRVMRVKKFQYIHNIIFGLYLDTSFISRPSKTLQFIKTMFWLI